MKNILENSPETTAKLQQLIDNKVYVGEIMPGGFILKRNFGIRRIPVYGTLEDNNFKVKAKNETLHEYFLWSALLLMMGILIFAAYHYMFLVVGVNAIFIIVMFLMDKQRKQKEIEQFFNALKEN